MQDGASVATSMGFSALDGLMMGTRCGALDPGVLLHLLRAGWTADRLEKLLYKDSGLAGVSGISAMVGFAEPAPVDADGRRARLYIVLSGALEVAADTRTGRYLSDRDADRFEDALQAEMLRTGAIEQWSS